MTQSNNRISERRLCEDPVLMVPQKPEAESQTSDSLQRTFASKDAWTKGVLWNTLQFSPQGGVGCFGFGVF